MIDTTNFTDAGSGIATYAITRSNAQAPAIPGVSCPAAGYTGATAVTSPDTVPTDAMCYVYTVTATDNVGNVATLTTSPILVDTSVTASSSSTGVAATTLAWSHTTTNKAMRMLVVGVVAELATNGCQATGVTYGAQTLTKIAQAATVTGAFVECSSLWYVMAPTVGTNTITVTYQASIPSLAAGAIGLWNIKQAAPDAFNTSFNDAGATTTSVTSVAANSVAVDVFANGNAKGTLAPGPGQAQQWIQDVAAQTESGSGSTELIPAPGTVNMTWVGGPVNRSSSVAAVFAPGDITTPTNAFAVASASPVGSAFLSGATVYYRGGTGNSGSFQLRDTVADAGSGPASAAFNTLTGTTTGWTHTQQTINTPAGRSVCLHELLCLGGRNQFVAERADRRR